MTCSESIIESGATIVPTAFERNQRRTQNAGTVHSVHTPKWPNGDGRPCSCQLLFMSGTIAH
jgi:hypothetical protein